MFRVSAVKSCLLVLPENVLIKIYQDDYLNRTRRRMIPIYMPKCMGKSSCGLSPTQKARGN